jgi:hypothetical protein
MAMNNTKALRSVCTQIGVVDFLTCRSAPAHR